jgi:adenosine tuberculosinyltransferase
MMDIEAFLSLPTEEVAQIVHEAGPKVCVFPINGTRRWFMLEYPRMGENLKSGYLDITGCRYIELYKLFFSHGIHTMLIPVFGPDLLGRGENYMKAIAEGMQRLTLHPDFLEFYRDYQVRVRFYGDYRKFLGSTPYAYLIENFAQIGRAHV